MNQISTSFYQTRYARVPHWMLMIDGLPIDQVMAQHCQNPILDGFFPTILRGWNEDPAAEQLVWDRILPVPGNQTWVPILMCADDCDFWCILVVVEVVATETMIIWQRVGYAAGDASMMPASRLESVDWCDGGGPWMFDRAAYAACLQTFFTDKPLRSKTLN